ncbi:phosphohydrolase [Pseudooceanicola lipolyticus]|uniref:Phosphohydrolase n=1 Tax=Pseudooceanicola lipolyticus TaxID=2029104 RepID=A0A2M8IYB9_9RHOB|nr:metallophosphoesterase [Pseudooceanicola lipolyticus]PJE35533.1 phosphohydrolase [Pseudooceanicola lipolyticus]
MGHDPTFVHLTDLHFGEPDDPHLHSDTDATMAQIIDQVQRIDPKPDFVIASGDLANSGDAPSYRKLAAALAALDMPILFALGNHDTREGFYEGMLGHETGSSAPYDHDQVIAGVHIIVLDSSVPGAISGALDPAQFDWLEARLADHADLPKLIVIHHPPMLGDTPDEDFWRGIRFEDSQRLAETLRGHDIRGILSGHIHHDRFSVWHGIPVIVGMGQHAATDILATDRLRMVRGASFGIGRIRRSGLTMALVPLPSDRAELNVYPLAMLRERAAEIEAAAQARNASTAAE